MGERAQRFRRRAADCRLLAQSARDGRDTELLEDIADELDAEADRIDYEDEARPKGDYGGFL